MNRVAYPVVLVLSLALLAGCGGPRAAAPSAKDVASTAAPRSATTVPASTATAAPVSTATAVPASTATPVPHLTATAAPPPTSTARAVSPTSPVKQATPAGIPSSNQGGDWKLYRDESRGIQFSYPTACTVAQHDGSFTVGGRIDLVIADAKGLALQDYVSQFVDEKVRTNGWKVESQQTVPVGGDNAVRVDYRFGGTNRFGTATFLDGKGRVYVWGLTAGAFTCDEPAAFDGIVSSFRVTR